METNKNCPSSHWNGCDTSMEVEIGNRVKILCLNDFFVFWESFCFVLKSSMIGFSLYSLCYITSFITDLFGLLFFIRYVRLSSIYTPENKILWPWVIHAIFHHYLRYIEYFATLKIYFRIICFSLNSNNALELLLVACHTNNFF